ncbi:hypothetical protein CLOM_g5726 [Closterium sp. NIES-68]|nr:hypothetical protein CLOM_g5726 [Closterium sp. NIES-68]GJP73770.1 hypothetical protein CLOP_g4457 [Closterium sp. NIES-67]
MMSRGARGPRRPPHLPTGKAAGGGDWFASLRGRTLMSIALVAVVASTRRTWFPSAQLAALLVDRGGCEFPIQLNARGALEGPWVNHSSLSSHDLLDLATRRTDGGGSSASSWDRRHAFASDAGGGGGVTEAEFYTPVRYQGMGKVVAAEEGEDDGKAPWGHVVEGLLTAGTLSTGNRLTLAFARLAERFLASWVRIDGITKGLGKAGMVKQIMFPAMAVNPKMQPCLAQVRIVQGRVYFRYGYFLEDARKLKRVNLAVKMILQAITAYDLRSLRAELFINACDKPVSFDNSLSSGCSGFPVFSTQWTPGSTDILFPDPLDLDFSPPAHAEHVPWPKKEGKAVWRGSGFEFQLKPYNWASSFRLRLHRTSDSRPDLLDARLASFGKDDLSEPREMLIKNGFVLAEELDEGQKEEAFKYVVVVDERVGSRDMCRALSGQQAVIRHLSGFMQYFEPLLLPGVHYIPVTHSFTDVVDAVEWMRQHDDAVHTMVLNANELASHVCTWHSRVHYWAVLLAKYSARAMETPQAVVAPTVCEGGKALESAEWAAGKVTNPSCKVEGKDASEGKCLDFCVTGVPEEKWTWLDAKDSLASLEIHDPFGHPHAPGRAVE